MSVPPEKYPEMLETSEGLAWTPAPPEAPAAGAELPAELSAAIDSLGLSRGMTRATKVTLLAYWPALYARLRREWEAEQQALLEAVESEGFALPLPPEERLVVRRGKTYTRPTFEIEDEVAPQPAADLEAALAEAIERALLTYRCQYTVGEDDDHLHLVDALTAAGEPSIETGRREIEMLAEAISEEALPLLRQARGEGLHPIGYGHEGEMAVCPDCGPGVGLDEDGCCTSCGADTSPAPCRWVPVAPDSSRSEPAEPTSWSEIERVIAQRVALAVAESERPDQTALVASLSAALRQCWPAEVTEAAPAAVKEAVERALWHAITDDERVPAVLAALSRCEFEAARAEGALRAGLETVRRNMRHLLDEVRGLDQSEPLVPSHEYDELIHRLSFDADYADSILTTLPSAPAEALAALLRLPGDIAKAAAYRSRAAERFGDSDAGKAEQMVAGALEAAAENARARLRACGLETQP